MHAFVEVLEVFLQEHPLISYDVQILKSKSLPLLESFFMGHGIFHLTLNCTLNLRRVWLVTANRSRNVEYTVDETGVDETGVA